jgi:hypothetical protein
VFVGLSLAFVAAHGVEADGCFCTASTTTGGLCLITAARTPLQGGRRYSSWRRGCHTEFPLDGAGGSGFWAGSVS